MSTGPDKMIHHLNEAELDQQLKILEGNISELRETKLELENELDKGVSTLETIVKMEVFNDYIGSKKKPSKH
jgi:hypothetical protein